ncbi:MAG: hypothetical protein AAF636_23255 [Pseudomonadota bacterium]
MTSRQIRRSVRSCANAPVFAQYAPRRAIDPRGRFRMTGMRGAHDCRRFVKPDQVRAHCEGDLVWNIGMAPSDGLPVEGGRIMAENFGDAPAWAPFDMPPITVELRDTDAPSAGARETMIVAGEGAVALRPIRSDALRWTRSRITSDFPASRCNVVSQTDGVACFGRSQTLARK